MDTTIYKCPYCSKEIENRYSYTGHMTSCKNNPNYNLIIQKRKDSIIRNSGLRERLLKCIVCDSQYTLKLTDRCFNKGNFKKTCCPECAHKLQSEHVDKNERNNKTRSTIIKKYIDNFSIEDHIKKRICEYCGKTYELYDLYARKYSGYSGEETEKYCCKNCMIRGRHEKLSRNAKRIGLGGYNEYSASGYHKGTYKGIRFDSSWELAFLIYYIEHELHIKRCEEVRIYNYKDKIRKYYPDFITDDGIIEIKGYVTEQTKCKLRDNPDVKVLFQNDMKKYINYAIDKYGKTFWKEFTSK